MNHAALMDLIRSKQEFTYRGASPSLREIARQTNIPPSTFTRLRNGMDMNAEALLRILVWLNVQGNEPWGRIMQAITGKQKAGRNGR